MQAQNPNILKMNNTIHNLTFIRKKINSIDNLLKKLLQRRSIWIPKVKSLKKKLSYRIAFTREAKIINKIQHSKFGYFKKGYMQKIWREIVAASLDIECGLKIGIYGNKTMADTTTFALWEITKDHFGSATNFSLDNNIVNLLHNLLQNNLDAIVLPHFTHPSKWWFTLRNKPFNQIKINLMLPTITAFHTLYDIKGVCLSLNNQDILENKYYISKKIIEYTIDTKNNWYLIETRLDLQQLKTKYYLTDAELIFIGSSAILV